MVNIENMQYKIEREEKNECHYNRMAYTDIVSNLFKTIVLFLSYSQLTELQLFVGTFLLVSNLFIKCLISNLREG